MSALGDTIRAVRMAQNITQVELAKMAGVTQQTLSRIESGAIERTKAALDIAVALGIDPHALASEDLQILNIPGVTLKDVQHINNVNGSRIFVFDVTNAAVRKNEKKAIASLETPSWLARYIDLFALVMPDDSMSPAIQPGSVLIIDGKAKPTNRAIVALIERDSKRALITNYIEAGSDKMSVPGNPQFPSKRLGVKTKYLGKVVTVIHDYSGKLLPN